MDRFLRWISHKRKQLQKRHNQRQLRLDLKERDEELESLRRRVENLQEEVEGLKEELEKEQVKNRVKHYEVELLSAVHASDVERWRQMGDKEVDQG